MTVLHITGWFPNDANIHEALWIKRHIDSLSNHVESNFVLHLEVKPSGRFKFHKKNLENGIQRQLEIPVRSWFLIELVTGILLALYLYKFRRRKYDIINFHVAYPLMVYWHVIKSLTRKPVVITEHWSAYHLNFGLPVSKKLRRIKRIFKQEIPVITVSRALANDIKKFAKADFKNFVLPNVVDTSIFHPGTLARKNHFLMVSQWKHPKRPLVVAEAFKEFEMNNPGFRLIIAGYGPDYPMLGEWVKKHGLENRILLPGRLDSKEIASYLTTSKAFIHCSEYETFSVVCAEAVSCHTPVLASNVGGIGEIISRKNGILIGSFDRMEWVKGMNDIINSTFTFSESKSFSKEEIGKQYFSILLECRNLWQK